MKLQVFVSKDDEEKLRIMAASLIQHPQSLSERFLSQMIKQKYAEYMKFKENK